MTPEEQFTAFVGPTRIAAGPLPAVARAAHANRDAGVLVFADATGQPVDLDLRGSEAETLDRLPSPPPKPGRGRPKLGVVAREVTLLPRHWEWLSAQPGGASAALRRLVEKARSEAPEADRLRLRQEAAYRVMTALGGDLPGYEDAVRALFAADAGEVERRVLGWPADIRDYVVELTRRAVGARP